MQAADSRNRRAVALSSNKTANLIITPTKPNSSRLQSSSLHMTSHTVNRQCNRFILVSGTHPDYAESPIGQFFRGAIVTGNCVLNIALTGGELGYKTMLQAQRADFCLFVFCDILGVN